MKMTPLLQKANFTLQKLLNPELTFACWNDTEFVHDMILVNLDLHSLSKSWIFSDLVLWLLLVVTLKMMDFGESGPLESKSKMLQLFLE